MGKTPARHLRSIIKVSARFGAKTTTKAFITQLSFSTINTRPTRNILYLLFNLNLSNIYFLWLYRYEKMYHKKIATLIGLTLFLEKYFFLSNLFYNKRRCSNSSVWGSPLGRKKQNNQGSLNKFRFYLEMDIFVRKILSWPNPLLSVQFLSDSANLSKNIGPLSLQKLHWSPFVILEIDYFLPLRSLV